MRSISIFPPCHPDSPALPVVNYGAEPPPIRVRRARRRRAKRPATGRLSAVPRARGTARLQAPHRQGRCRSESSRRCRAGPPATARSRCRRRGRGEHRQIGKPQRAFDAGNLVECHVEAVAAELAMLNFLKLFAQLVIGLWPDRLLEFGEDHRSEEHTSELQSLMRISYAVFCLKKTKNKQ